MIAPAVPPPNVRSSPGATSDGSVSGTPPVVQFAAVAHRLLSPAVPTNASPSKMDAAALSCPAVPSTAATAIVSAASGVEDARLKRAVLRRRRDERRTRDLD